MVTTRQFVKDLRNIIMQAVGNNSLQLGKGQCADFAEYKRKVGVIAGMEAASEMADQLLRKIEDQDDGDL